jgi:hypothetical protein
MFRFACLLGLIGLALVTSSPALAAPEGTATWGLHVTIASR